MSRVHVVLLPRGSGGYATDKKWWNSLKSWRENDPETSDRDIAGANEEFWPLVDLVDSILSPLPELAPVGY
jgi:hypothetical protein